MPSRPDPLPAHVPAPVPASASLLVRSRTAVLTWASAAALAVATVLATAPVAAAEPATTAAYPAGATATRYSGLAFDACTAPPLTTIRAWTSSPYRALGVYLSGVNRTCAQPQLTASWVASVSALKWRLLPIHKGLQPSCGARASDAKISTSATTARSQGTAAATQAVTAAKALGMLPGSALYNDIENYSQTNATCRTSVLSYVSGWTKELHRLGWLSGVYMNLSLGAKQLADVYTSTGYARPDALWVARYDGIDSLKGWAGVADGKWAVHQRAKQFRGGHDETYGGVRVNIDTDRLDTPVATVAYPYRTTAALTARSGPTTTAAAVTSYARGATVRVVCQTSGPKVGTSTVWDKLSTGAYVADHYVDTPSTTSWSPPLPRCTYPYQIASATGVTERSGPGTSYTALGTAPNGALAWVTCQKSGTAVGGTKVWDRLDNGHYVSDHYVSTPSGTTYSKPVPHC
ncbi:glycoside hydrolase domain-containing protein [Streptomyces longwoodensis]|uniref:glycoside hydrolase domain-containing protein n=1 Tax=Streptomyces longwoodensis TaxID=68231 RepID=UPI003825F2F6